MDAKINGYAVKAYVDSGATVSLMSGQLLNNATKELKPFPYKVVDASGNNIPILGTIDAYISTPDGQVSEQMVVVRPEEGIQIEILLGMNVLKHSTINFPDDELRFKMDSLQRCVNNEDYTLEIISRTLKRSINTDDERTNHFTAKQASPAEARIKQASTGPPQDDKDNEEDQGCSRSPVYNIHIRRNMELPANTITIVQLKTPKELKENQCIHVFHNELRNGVVIPNVVTQVKKKHITLKITNLNDEKITLLTGTKISEAEDVIVKEESNEGPITTSIPEDDEGQLHHNGTQEVHAITNDTKEKPSPLRRLTEEDIQCGDKKMIPEILTLVNKYRGACWLEGEPLGTYTGDPLEIKLKEDVVVNKPSYRIPHAQQEKLDVVIQEMQKDGIISRSKSDFNSPLILVPKGDSFRVCIDFRKLNEKIQPVSFPIPRIADLLQNTGQTKVISSMDLASAFHQTPIKPEDREKTAFTVRNTKYHYNKTPFGIQSAPGYFSRVINETLYDLLGPEVLAYMDDILIFGKDNEQHLARLEEVLQRLSEVNIKIKLIKCKFFVDEVKFLGYQVTKNGMKMNDERTKAINDMPHPTNKKQLQAFLGVVNYYRRFVKNFAQTAEPLYALLKKDARFRWGDRQANAVEELKEKLTRSPIVKFPDFQKEFHIHTDASTGGIGAVLMQEHDGILHPIEYVSRALNDAQKAYATTKLEALALVWALEQFRTIILHYPVHVYTDHKPLIGVMSTATKDACITRWTLNTLEYQIKLHYLPGKENLFADALSRLAQVEAGCDQIEIEREFQEKLLHRINQCNVLRNNIPEKVPWQEKELRKNQLLDQKCTEIKKMILSAANDQVSKSLTKFRIIDGIIYVLRTITRSPSQEEQFLVPYIPDKMMKKAFHVIHEETTAGHRGYERTMITFTKNFYNYQESKVIREMCDSCEPCIKAKAIAKMVPLEKYPVPERPFQSISSDILGPLPITEQGNQYVLVVRDHTTRYTVLYPLKYKTTDNIIQALRYTISNYGSSEVLVTDNAQEYVSEKMKKFCKFYNTRKVEISPHHPQGQGVVERINRELNQFLRIYTDVLATEDWDDLLPVLQLTINNTFNASIKETPFYALYGYDSFSETLQPPKTNYDESDLALRMQRITAIRKHCREKLLEAQAKYTDYANRKRTPKEISIGQRVYAKLKKFKPHYKLDFPISGPFTVVQKQGNAYQLQDMTTKKKWLVHPDFIIQPRKGGARTQSDENRNRKETEKEKAEAEVTTKPAPDLSTPSKEQSYKKPHGYNLRPRAKLAGL